MLLRLPKDLLCIGINEGGKPGARIAAGVQRGGIALISLRMTGQLRQLADRSRGQCVRSRRLMTSTRRGPTGDGLHSLGDDRYHEEDKTLAARGFQSIHGLDQFQDGDLDRIIPRESTAVYQRNPIPRLTVFGPDRLHGPGHDDCAVTASLSKALPPCHSGGRGGRQKVLISSARHSKTSIRGEGQRT